MPRLRFLWWCLIIAWVGGIGLSGSMRIQAASTGTSLELSGWQSPPNLSQFVQNGPRQYLATPTLTPSAQLAEALQHPNQSQTGRPKNGWLPQTDEARQILLSLAVFVGLLVVWLLWLIWRHRRE